MAELDEAQKGMAHLAAFVNQLQRTLWLTIQTAGGKVELDEKAVNPLWRIDKIRRDDGILVLTSSITPPPTEDQMTALVNKLRGTKIAISDVQKELGLTDWPESYLAFQISSKLLAIDGGVWRDTELVKAEATHRGLN